MSTTTDMSPQDLRDRAAANLAAAQKSFEACDTDGFKSQWASGLTGSQDRLRAEILENDGRWTYPALFDLNGSLVPAKRIDTPFGMRWAILNPANPSGRFLGFSSESQASNPERARATDAKKGYCIGYVSVSARAEIRGGNATCLSAVAVRMDGGFSADAIVVDNGHGEGSGSYYRN